MRRFLLAAGLLALAAPAPAFAQRKPFLKLVRGSEYELRDDGAKAEVSVPVTLSAGAKMRRIRATLVSVSLGQREDLALVDAFAVTPDRPTSGRGPRLRVTIKTDPGLEPGTYNLVVDVRRTDKPGRRKRRRQRLELALAHPAAVLRAPPTVVVERDGGFPLIDDEDDHARPLRLRETSRKTQLSDVEVVQIDGPTGTEVTNGELRFGKLAAIEPGGRATAEPSAHGDFQLGSSTGTLEIDAPQLEDPVTATFEVQRTAHWLWLVLVIAGGVLAGWLVRHLLAGVIARNQARQPGYALLDAITVEHERRRDAGFRARISEIRTGLERVLQTERDSGRIEEAVNGARTELQSALADLDGDRDAAQAALTGLVAVVQRPWTAPKGLTDALAAQAGALDEAARLLDVYDVGQAEAKLRDCRAAIDSALREHVPPWASGVRTFLADLDEARLPQPVMNEVRAGRTAVDTALASTGIDQVAIDPDTVMRGVHAAETRLRLLLTESLVRVRPAVTAVLDELKGLPSKPALDAVAAADQALAEALRQAPGQADLPAVGSRASALVRALRAAIREPVPANAQAPLVRINAKMDAGRYVEAARLAFEAAPRERKDLVLGIVAGAAPAEAADAGGADLPILLTDVAVAAAPALVVQTTRGLRDSAFDLARARAASLAALADANLLRTLIIGAVVIAVGCGLFLPSFTGTFAQYLAAFLWGFAADVTSEGLYQLAKSSGAPATPAPQGSTPQT